MYYGVHRTVEFEVELEQFVLSRFVADDPRREIKFDRIVPNGTPSLSFLWLSPPSEHVDDELASLEEVDSVEVLGRSGNWVLCDVTWNRDRDALPQLFRILAETDAAVLSIRTVGGQWHFRVRFRTSDSVSAFQNRCLANGVALQVTSIQNAPLDRADVLTDRQREILNLAVERGYYEVPRQVTLQDLADELGIAIGAASEGLRRAESRVVRSHFST